MVLDKVVVKQRHCPSLSPLQAQGEGKTTQTPLFWLSVRLLSFVTFTLDIESDALV